MATTERKYKGSLSLGKLEIALEAHEMLFGDIQKLEALGGFTIATYDDSDFPPAETIALVPKDIGLPADGNSLLFEGRATVLGVEVQLDVYRTS